MHMKFPSALLYGDALPNRRTYVSMSESRTAPPKTGNTLTILVHDITAKGYLLWVEVLGSKQPRQAHGVPGIPLYVQEEGLSPPGKERYY